MFVLDDYLTSVQVTKSVKISVNMVDQLDKLWGLSLTVAVDSERPREL